MDIDGLETTDPETARFLTSFGGHKGYGIAVLIEAMTSCLAGSAIGHNINSLALAPDKTNNVSYGFFAMRIDLFLSADDYRNNIDMLIDYLHSIPSVEGKKVLYPGEIEFSNREFNLQNGIDIPIDLYNSLFELAKQQGINNVQEYFE